MNISEPLGIPGAPQETLQAVLATVPPQNTRLIMLTDRQGDRLHASYAALLVTGHGPSANANITAEAFGPRYGKAGISALAELGHWASANQMPIRETVLNAAEMGRMVSEPSPHEIAAMIAASNPSDAGIYTTPPEKQFD